MKKSLLLDIDDVVCFPGFLKTINDFLGTCYQIDDFSSYYMEEEVIPKEWLADFYDFVNRKNLYDDAVILPQAVETIEILDYLYDVYPCSSCVNPFDLVNSGRFFKDKYDFLMSVLPFINPERYIFTSSKHLINGDIKIDDRLQNLSGDIETKILFPSYHNINVFDDELKKCGVVRAGYDWRNGWNRVANLLIEDGCRPKVKVKDRCY